MHALSRHGSGPGKQNGHVATQNGREHRFQPSRMPRGSPALAAKAPVVLLCICKPNRLQAKTMLSYLEQIGNAAATTPSVRGQPMLILDPLFLTALASVLTALSGLIWSVRRKP